MLLREVDADDFQDTGPGVHLVSPESQGSLQAPRLVSSARRERRWKRQSRALLQSIPDRRQRQLALSKWLVVAPSWFYADAEFTGIAGFRAPTIELPKIASAGPLQNITRLKGCASRCGSMHFQVDSSRRTQSTL